MDNQIKIQGYRVELGEVEAAIRAAACGLCRRARQIARLSITSNSIKREEGTFPLSRSMHEPLRRRSHDSRSFDFRKTPDLNKRLGWGWPFDPAMKCVPGLSPERVCARF